MYCDKCGSKLEITDKFCTSCGKNVEEIKTNSTFCTSCNNPINVGDNFCDKCGANVSVGYSVLANKKPNYKKIKWAIICVSVVVISIIVITCLYANSPGQKILGRWSTQSSDSKILDFKSNGTVYYKEDLFTSGTYTYKVSGNRLIFGGSDRFKGTHYYNKSAITDNHSADTWYIDNDILYIDGWAFYRQ